MKESTIDRLMRYADALGTAHGEASYTQGYRSREKPYYGPEERRLYEKERLQWEQVDAQRKRLRLALQRALRKSVRDG